MVDGGIIRADTAVGTIRTNKTVNIRSHHLTSRPQQASSPYLNLNMLMLFLSMSMGIIPPSNRRWRVTCLEDMRHINLNQWYMYLLLLLVLELGCRLYHHRFRSSRSH